MTEKNDNARTEDHNDDMRPTLTSMAGDEGFWRTMWRQARLAWYLIRSPEVPLYLKVLPVLAIVYVLLPTDFIPDVFPVIGQLDDLTALLVGAKVFIELAPQEVVARYVQSMREGRAAGDSDARESVKPDQDEVENLVVIEGDYDVVDHNMEDRAD